MGTIKTNHTMDWLATTTLYHKWRRESSNSSSPRITVISDGPLSSDRQGFTIENDVWYLMGICTPHYGTVHCQQKNWSFVREGRTMWLDHWDGFSLYNKLIREVERDYWHSMALIVKLKQVSLLYNGIEELWWKCLYLL